MTSSVRERIKTGGLVAEGLVIIVLFFMLQEQKTRTNEMRMAAWSLGSAHVNKEQFLNPEDVFGDDEERERFMRFAKMTPHRRPEPQKVMPPGPDILEEGEKKD